MTIVSADEARLHEREPERVERATVHDLAHTVVVQAEQIAAALELHGRGHWCEELGIYRRFNSNQKCSTARALGVTA